MDFSSIADAAEYTGDSAAKIAKWIETNSAGRRSYWRFVKSGQQFPIGPYPVVCRETGKTFYSGHDLALAGFNPATVAKATVRPDYRAGCRFDDKKYRFYRKPLPIAFSIRGVNTE